VKQILGVAIIALFGISCGQQERKAPAPAQESIVQKAEEKSSSALISEAKEKLAAAKSKLEQDGKYDCCLREPCNHCALSDSSCTCSQEVKRGEAVCNECYAGWQEGKGDVPNIKKENVKADFMEQARKR
jgi:hypothetical protein